MKIMVLGCGLVGGPMAVDLQKQAEFDVTVVDVNDAALERIQRQAGVRTVRSDLSRSDEVARLVEEADLVVNAVPGFMGYQTLRTVIERGKNVVDIAFFPEDPFSLDALAKERGVTAIVDCGVAPGLSNLLIGFESHQFDSTEEVIIYVGGLPVVRHWPFEYKAVFSPIDVIEEYTRPARLVVGGKQVIRPALSDPELLDFPGVGTLEAFNSDGLRTLAETIDAPDMKEKTLRYPGHIEKMAFLREVGFFSKKEIEVDGARVRPLDITAKLMFPLWEMAPGDHDLTVMQVIVEGIKNGCRIRHTYHLLDRYDADTDTHSMARTTGYVATVATRMLAQGLFAEAGVHPPEFVGRHEACVAFILDGLAQRSVKLHKTSQTVEDA